MIKGLQELGHRIELVSLYLPLFPEEKNACATSPLFLGGVNLYLQEKSAFFRALPPNIDSSLSNPGFLKRVSEIWNHTDPADLGPLTISTLKGEQGNQRKEIERLTSWLEEQEPPEAVLLSNIMLLGLAAPLRRALKVPIYCTLQGEEPFLDALPEPYRSQSWNLLQELSMEADRLIAVSSSYGARMRKRLNLSREKVAIALNGIDLEGFPEEPALRQEQSEHPRIGYLAHIREYKGARRLVRAFITLSKNLEDQGSPLRPLLSLAGAVTKGDESFIEALKSELVSAGFSDRVEFLPNIERDEKLRFLSSLSLCCVPSDESEAFGLFTLEALASGVPVLMPNYAANPEILAASGGGILYDPKKENGLAEALYEAVQAPEKLAKLGREGAAGVRKNFRAKHMAERVLEAMVPETQRVDISDTPMKRSQSH